MRKILYLTSSPRGSQSQSIRLGNMLVERLREKDPEAAVIVRDLVVDPVPPVTGDWVGGRYLPTEQQTPAQAEALATSLVLIAELKSADIVVMGTPMINFSIAAPLKAWIDQIVRGGHTFKMEQNGATGLLGGKTVYVVETSGGIYDEPPLSAMNFQRPYLQFLLAFLGITDVHFVTAGGMSMGEEIANAQIAKAEAQVAALTA